MYLFQYDALALGMSIFKMVLEVWSISGGLLSVVSPGDLITKSVNDCEVDGWHMLMPAFPWLLATGMMTLHPHPHPFLPTLLFFSPTPHHHKSTSSCEPSHSIAGHLASDPCSHAVGFPSSWLWKH